MIDRGPASYKIESPMKLYRLFRIDVDGQPVVGPKFGMLGVRPVNPAFPKKRFDVNAVVGSDLVCPGSGGFSVFSDPAAIQIQASDLVLFEIDTADLGNRLIQVEAGQSHYHVEPCAELTLEEFQHSLAETRNFWRPV